MISGIDKYLEDIALHRGVDGVDLFNNPVRNFVYYDTFKGRIRQLTASEVYTANKDGHIYTHRLYCRPMDIKETDVLMYRDQQYAVKTINNLLNFDELYQVELEQVKI